MAVFGDFEAVIVKDLVLNEGNDQSSIVKFGTGGRRTGPALGGEGALCMLDYSWAAIGTDAALVFINDQLIGTIRATDNKQHAGRILAFAGSVLKDGALANTFRIDIDSPNPNLQLTLHTVVVFFHQG